MGFFLRFLGINKSIWLDEASSLKLIMSHNFWDSLRQYDHPPLYFLFLKMWSNFDLSEQWLRLPSAIIGGVTVMVLFAVSQNENKLSKIIIVLISATLPILLINSQQIRGYAFLLFFTSLAYYFAQKLTQHPEFRRNDIWGLTISLVVCSSIHLVGIFLIPAIFIFLYFKSGHRIPKHIYLIILVFPLIFFLFNYLVFIPPFVRSRSILSWGESQIGLGLLVFVPWYYSGYTEVVQGFNRIGGSDNSFIIKTLITGCFMILLTNILFGDWRRSFPYLLSALIYWLGLIFYSLFFVVIFSERTALPGLIPIVIFIAIQLSSNRSKWITNLTIGAGIVVVIGFLLNWLLIGAWKPLENWRSLLETLTAEITTDDVILVYPGHAIDPFYYYFPDFTNYSVISLAPKINHNQQKQLLDFITTGHNGRIFLVVRPDSAIKKNQNSLNWLKETLDQVSRNPIITNYGWLSLTKY